ncbi:MAG: AAA family ATPase [Planctomycetota bacterium]
MREALQHGDIDLVAVNLDSKDSFDTIVRITSVTPYCGIIGISSNTDPITIIKANRAGCNHIIPWPVDTQDLQEAVESFKTTRNTTTMNAKQICIIGSSGGAGTTTIACNLALEIGMLLDQQCALIDMNLGLGDVGGFFDIQNMYSVADICQEGTKVDGIMLNKAFHELPCKVSILDRPIHLRDADRVTPVGVANMLVATKQLFPYVIIDLPQSFNNVTDIVLRYTDKVLIVSQLGVSPIFNMTRIHEYLCQAGVPEDDIKIVLNRYNADFCNITLDDVEEHFNKPVFGMIPNDYERIKLSLDRGHPVITDGYNNPTQMAIHEIARKLIGEQVQNQEIPAAEQGSLSRLWKQTPQNTESENTQPEEDKITSLNPMKGSLVNDRNVAADLAKSSQLMSGRYSR